jgi:hypothetical protein
VKNLNIFKSFLVASDLNGATFCKDNFRCDIRTFYRGKTDKRCTLRIIKKDTKKYFKDFFTLEIFITGNHNTPRNHYTMTNPHVLRLIREDHALLQEDKIDSVINFIIEFANTWRQLIEFDSDELTENTEPNREFLYKFNELL